MDSIMRVPFKVSTTTSNFMIGVTAAASAVVYLQRGYIEPGLVMPVVIGVLLGALTGSKIFGSRKVYRVVTLGFCQYCYCTGHTNDIQRCNGYNIIMAGLSRFKDTNMQAVLGWVLRVGVFLSMTVVFIGGVIYIYRHGHSIANYHDFKGVPAFVHTVPGIINGIFNLHGQAIIQAGIILLVATPVVRVIFSAFGFILEKDWLVPLYYAYCAGNNSCRYIYRQRRLKRTGAHAPYLFFVAVIMLSLRLYRFFTKAGHIT